MNKANLQPLKGFRDFLHIEAKARQKVFSILRQTFERYGFLPYETPALEYREVVADKIGDDAKTLLYSFKDQGGREVALRYEFTGSLARFFAQNRDKLPTPFKGFQIGPVWRAEKPQKGRFREFYQCDIDIVGSSSGLADAEAIGCLNEVFIELGLNDAVIRINNRRFLEALIVESEISKAKIVPTIRILDKLDKVGQQAARGELASIGVQTKSADKLFEQIGQEFETSHDLVEKFSGLEGAGELAETVEALLSMGVKNYRVDLTLARGLDYYTGTVFEFIVPDASQFGSVAGGGRYDGLIKNTPAVGGSIGVDRLIGILEERELIKYDLVLDVLVCNMEEGLVEKYLQTVKSLRIAGIKTDFYFQPDKLERQLRYADKKNINFAVIIGPTEHEKGKVAIKNMATGKQWVVTAGRLIKELKNILDN